MTQTEWSMWANEQAVVSGFVLMTGGILGIAGQFHNWPFGIYGLVASLIILAFEWPRGKRIKGRTVERIFQKPFAFLVDKFGVAGRNYFIRFVFYLLLCVPCCFILATVLGGVCLLMTSVIYLLAAMKGEEWRSIYAEEGDGDKNKRSRSIRPPNKPPPRLAQNTEGGSQGASVSTSSITVDITDSANSQGLSNDKKPRRPPPRPKTAARDGVQNTG